MFLPIKRCCHKSRERILHGSCSGKFALVAISSWQRARIVGYTKHTSNIFADLHVVWYILLMNASHTDRSKKLAMLLRCLAPKCSVGFGAKQYLFDV